MPDRNQIQQALLEPINLASIGILAVTGILVHSPAFLGAIVVEAVYLAVIPDSKWYAQILSGRYNREVSLRRERLKLEVGPTLPPSVMARFTRLETTRGQIGTQAFAGTKWFIQVLRKLDYLMEKFLLFASKQVQFQTYLNSILEEPDSHDQPAKVEPQNSPGKSIKRGDIQTDEAWVNRTVRSIRYRYRSETAGIDEALSTEENPHNQAILIKRKEVLDRRSLYVSQIGEILTNLNHQLQLMEDTFGLINDEIHARSPEQVLADIDDVAYQSDHLTEMLKVISPFEQMPVAPGADKLYRLPGKS